jgi:hypothetical protein
MEEQTTTPPPPSFNRCSDDEKETTLQPNRRKMAYLSTFKIETHGIIEWI